MPLAFTPTFNHAPNPSSPPNVKTKLFAALLLSALVPSLGAKDYPQIELQRAYAGIKTPKPISVVLPPDASGRAFLVLQGGKILILPKDRNAAKAETFLDISERDMIGNAFEEGLLGLVFHPKFAKNEKFYLYYTLQNPKRSRLAEWRLGKKSGKPDPNSERVLLEVPQPFWNHNSGNPVFGPDGYLYLPLGDGGKAHDPLDTAQNTFSLLGKLLRLDVDSRTGSLPYGIPKDNPFVGKPGHRAEIWALGLRNPWGVHWHLPTKTLFLADVGQNFKEEINVIVKGGNYGWSYREGSVSFSLKHREPPADAKFVEPIFDYDRADGLSVSGGIVYQGKKAPSLKGLYLFGDWGTGNFWGLRHNPGKKAEVRKISWVQIGAPDKETKEPGIPQKITKGIFKPVNFCADAKGELLVLDWNGVLYEISERK